MAESYAKLSSTLVHSTVWRESAETRVVWITLLALADQHGEVQASIPGLADVSRVTIPQCEHALAVFLAPDPYSRSKTLDGRRLTEIPGGWFVVNYDLYRGLLNLDHRRALTRDRVARHRAKKRAATDGNGVTRYVTPVTKSNANVRPSSKQYAVSSKQRTTTATTKADDEQRGVGVALLARLPNDCHDAVKAVTAKARNPVAWISQITAMLDGMHGPATTPATMALALSDMHVNGAAATAATLRAFVLRLTNPPPSHRNGNGVKREEHQKFLDGDT